MRQVLLVGTKKHQGQAILVWADIDLACGDKIRWNGSAWRVDALYGTRLSRDGIEARIREKPSRDETNH